MAIKGWINNEKVKWLQRNNPEIPGIVFKLAPLDNKTRKLEAVRTLWKSVLSYTGINGVFTSRPVAVNGFDIDHFVPFSFVMNDELWNLMPMDSSLNSSKSNYLPSWEDFFGGFANNQFIMYQLICEKHDVFALFEKCYKDNLHSIWAAQELYRQDNSREEFINILSKNMRPIYDSARRQGYSVWKYNP